MSATASVPPSVRPTVRPAAHGARIQALVRLLLAGFFVAVLVTAPPDHHLLLCWVMVTLYTVWSGVTAGLLPSLLPFTWPGLAVDVITLAAAPAAAAYLGSGLLIRPIDDEPVSYVVLRAVLLAVAGLACVLLTGLQRARVLTIARLLHERNHLLAELVQIEQREQRDLAETLHDGALQYVLAARQDLEPALAGDTESVQRVEFALAETTRLLRTTMSQLHPAALEAAGLLPVLKDVAGCARMRARFSIDVVTQNWDDSTRTPVDGLLLITVRELLTNVVKHAGAGNVVIQLTRTESVARLRVIDDGRGLGEVDLDSRLRNGHLGLASRRIRVEAAGGRMHLRDAVPHGTVAEVEVPL